MFPIPIPRRRGGYPPNEIIMGYFGFVRHRDEKHEKRLQKIKIKLFQGKGNELKCYYWVLVRQKYLILP